MGGVQACCGNQNEKMPETVVKETKDPALGTSALPPVVDSGNTASPQEVCGSNVAEPQAAAATKTGSEYQITIEKTEASRLGVDVDNQDGHTLLIESISEGLVDSWNNSCTDPSKKVMQGHRIVEVNKKRDDLSGMVEECKKNGTLNITLMRP